MTTPLTTPPPDGPIPPGAVQRTGPATRPRSARWRRRRNDAVRRDRNWFWIVFGWPALLMVLVVLFLRWRSPEGALTIAVVGFMPMLAAPLAFGVLGAWLGRSPTMRAAAAVMTAAFVFTVSPVDAVVGCGARSAPDAVTIYTANVQAGGGRASDVAAAVAAADADVVLMQEVQVDFLHNLTTNPQLVDYRYWSQDLDGRSRSRPVFSRWPIVDLEVERFVSAEIVHATIDGPTGRFTVTNVHTLAPAVQANIPTWHAQFDQLETIDRSAPRILAGDFNATNDHQPFRQLLNAGWTDAHDRKGCGFDATWPVASGVPFAFYRLDHVLVTDHFEVLDLRFGDPAGSDHKPVIAEVRLTKG